VYSKEPLSEDVHEILTLSENKSSEAATFVGGSGGSELEVKRSESGSKHSILS